VVSQINGFAVASIVSSMVGVVPFATGIPCGLGIIFGFVALSQIERAGGRQGGRNLAVAGICVGFALIAMFMIFVVVVLTHGGGLYD
jgi:hypothetical protein